MTESRYEGSAPFRYHGSKWRFYGYLESYLSRAEVYTESFGGSGAILMQKPASGIEVYNDIDRDLYTFFWCLHPDRRDKFLDRLSATPYSRQIFEEVDEAKRLGHWPTEPFERALYFFILTEQGWGGKKHNGRRSWRRQRTGGANAPNRAWAWADAPNRLWAISERLRHVFIENRSALDVIREYDSRSTLHYIDPPYPRQTRARPDHGYDHEMSDEEHCALLECCLQQKGQVIVSGMAHPIYDRMLAGWQRKEIAARTTSHDYVSVEVLWLSPNCISQPKLFAC